MNIIFIENNLLFIYILLTKKIYYFGNNYKNVCVCVCEREREREREREFGLVLL